MVLQDLSKQNHSRISAAVKNVTSAFRNNWQFYKVVNYSQRTIENSFETQTQSEVSIT